MLRRFIRESRVAKLDTYVTLNASATNQAPVTSPEGLPGFERLATQMVYP